MPLPAPGFWSDPTRTDIPVGSTGDAGLDMVNFGMPAGTEFGQVHHGGGKFGLIGPGGKTRVGGMGSGPAGPGGLPSGGVPMHGVPDRLGRMRSVRKMMELRGMLGDPTGGPGGF